MYWGPQPRIPRLQKISEGGRLLSHLGREGAELVSESKEGSQVRYVLWSRELRDGGRLPAIHCVAVPRDLVATKFDTCGAAELELLGVERDALCFTFLQNADDMSEML